MIAALFLAAALSAPSCLLPPVHAPVAQPFRAPACPYCAGHRGLGYRVASGTPVRAIGAGTVSFAGSVAGVRWLVVRHPDGTRASYGHLLHLEVASGDTVVAGQVLARSSRRLHLGLRDGTTYVDPATRLGRWSGRVRLVPSSGAPPRPGPAPTLVCPPRAPPPAST